MHQIDGPGATKDKRFTDGDPITPVEATQVTDDWLNMVQDELHAILAAAGMTPDKEDNTQVIAALRILLAIPFAGLAAQVIRLTDRVTKAELQLIDGAPAGSIITGGTGLDHQGVSPSPGVLVAPITTVSPGATAPTGAAIVATLAPYKD